MGQQLEAGNWRISLEVGEAVQELYVLITNPHPTARKEALGLQNSG